MDQRHKGRVSEWDPIHPSRERQSHVEECSDFTGIYMSPHAHPLVLTTFCLVKALISGCWLFGNRCLKPAKDFRHQTKREVERHSPFLPQIQLLNSLSLESNTREKRKLHEENRFNCIGLVFAIHCFWAHHVDRQDVKTGMFLCLL